MVVLDKPEQDARFFASEINALVIITDSQDNITYINPYVEQKLGFKQPEMINQVFHDLFLNQMT